MGNRLDNQNPQDSEGTDETTIRATGRFQGSRLSAILAATLAAISLQGAACTDSTPKKSRLSTNNGSNPVETMFASFDFKLVEQDMGNVNQLLLDLKEYFEFKDIGELNDDPYSCAKRIKEANKEIEEYIRRISQSKISVPPELMTPLMKGLDDGVVALQSDKFEYASKIAEWNKKKGGVWREVAGEGVELGTDILLGKAINVNGLTALATVATELKDNLVVLRNLLIDDIEIPTTPEMLELRNRISSTVRAINNGESDIETVKQLMIYFEFPLPGSADGIQANKIGKVLKKWGSYWNQLRKDNPVYGSKGPEVKRKQRFLIKAGYLPEGSDDEVCGAITIKALRDFGKAE